MMLSDHFSLAEMIASDTAARHRHQQRADPVRDRQPAPPVRAGARTPARRHRPADPHHQRLPQQPAQHAGRRQPHERSLRRPRRRHPDRRHLAAHALPRHRIARSADPAGDSRVRQLVPCEHPGCGRCAPARIPHRRQRSGRKPNTSGAGVTQHRCAHPPQPPWFGWPSRSLPPSSSCHRRGSWRPLEDHPMPFSTRPRLLIGAWISVATTPHRRRSRGSKSAGRTATLSPAPTRPISARTGPSWWCATTPLADGSGAAEAIARIECQRAHWRPSGSRKPPNLGKRGSWRRDCQHGRHDQL